MLAVREALCSTLDIALDVLPFIGDLLQVREDERSWEGAAERLLHAFGLSLRVPDPYYAEVSALAERTYLDERLL